MKYIKQLTIILAVSFAGEVLNYLIPLPIPAGIYGIVILFFLLYSKILPLSAVKEAGDFLIEIMPLMFIPAAVGLLDSWDSVRTSLVSYIIIIVISTVAVMAVSGVVTQLVIKCGRRSK